MSTVYREYLEKKASFWAELPTSLDEVRANLGWAFKEQPKAIKNALHRLESAYTEAKRDLPRKATREAVHQFSKLSPANQGRAIRGMIEGKKAYDSGSAAVDTASKIVSSEGGAALRRFKKSPLGKDLGKWRRAFSESIDDRVRDAKWALSEMIGSARRKRDAVPDRKGIYHSRKKAPPRKDYRKAPSRRLKDPYS